jgi:hypothetical protein
MKKLEKVWFTSSFHRPCGRSSPQALPRSQRKSAGFQQPVPGRARNFSFLPSKKKPETIVSWVACQLSLTL